MARYKDADALRETLSVIIENAEANGLYNIAFTYEHCLKVIEDTPTADVAPRAEVAREIFGEIEKLHLHITNDFDLRRYEELKKKYTEGEK